VACHPKQKRFAAAIAITGVSFPVTPATGMAVAINNVLSALHGRVGVNVGTSHLAIRLMPYEPSGDFLVSSQSVADSADTRITGVLRA
jgi:hypothetical protein